MLPTDRRPARRCAPTLPTALAFAFASLVAAPGRVLAQAADDTTAVRTYTGVDSGALGPAYYDPIRRPDRTPFTGTLVDRRADGRLAAWKQVRDGYADGLWLEWFPNGALRYRGAWRAGRQEGVHAYHFANGLPRESGTMSGGRLAGLLTTYTPDGRVASRCGYLADTLVAPCLEYAAAPEVGEVAWAAPSTRAVETEAWPDGRPKRWREVDAAGRADGRWLEWTADGTLRFRSGWRAGLGEGLWEYFHPDGRLRQVGVYRADALVGEEVELE